MTKYWDLRDKLKAAADIRKFFWCEPEKYVDAITEDIINDPERILEALQAQETECHQKSTSGGGLYEVTVSQVLGFLTRTPESTVSDDHALAEALTEFFNDPNRLPPQKPTMHPDLEWLARRDPVELVTNCTGPEPIRYFKDDVGNVAVYRSIGLRLNGRPTFTRTEIEQARRHLAREAQQRIIERGQKLRELEAERKAVLHPDNDPHIDAYVLGLNKLPDYETWFEDRGADYLTPRNPGIRPATTVHELYTHFRARLLDELRQDGVIGEK